MRWARIFSPIVLAVIVFACGLSWAGIVHATRFARFGGETDDNFWHIAFQYCRDGVVVSATQQTLSTDFANFGADGARFSLQLTAAAPSVNVFLPYRIAGGDGSTMVTGGARLMFMQAQQPGTPVQITVERWDHGHATAVEPQDNSTATDHSTSDDVQTDSGGVVEDCYIVPPTFTPTVTSTATATSTPTTTATMSATPVPSDTATNTPAPVDTMTSTPSLTSTPSPSSTSTPTPSPAVRQSSSVTFAAARLPRIMAIQAAVDLGNAGGHGRFSEALKLFVPAGTLPVGMKLGVEAPRLAAEPGSHGSVGLGYIFTLSPQVGGQAIANAGNARPLLLQISYDPAQTQGIDPATLRIGSADDSSHTWTDLPTTVDTVHHVLTARVVRLARFQARAFAHSNAQFGMAKARLALIAGSGTPTISMLPTLSPALGGIPLELLLPSGSLHGPAAVGVTGAPGATLQAVFTFEGISITQNLVLDARGYAVTYFAPPAVLKYPQPLTAAVTVSLGGPHYTTVVSANLLAGPRGALPSSGAPPLWSTLVATAVRVGTVHPRVVVLTAPGVVVSAELRLRSKPVATVLSTFATADSHGVARLTLPFIPRSSRGLQLPATLRIVVTASRRGATSRQVLMLTASA